MFAFSFNRTKLYLIPFLHQTTTPATPPIITPLLYLIPFLHQTTTRICLFSEARGCILFHFYIKPQRFFCAYLQRLGCILFHFYIKPQPRREQVYGRFVVSYSISTSNHNRGDTQRLRCVLYLIPFLHQTTTRHHLIKSTEGCILFHFYIKPQHLSTTSV